MERKAKFAEPGARGILTRKFLTDREEVVVGSGASGVERKVEELRHDQADYAEHGNTAVLDLGLLITAKGKLPS